MRYIPVPVLDRLLRDAIEALQDPARRDELLAEEEQERERIPGLIRARTRTRRGRRMSRTLTRTCKAHCAACGSHFSGEEAFDRHRQGAHDPRPGEEPCHCEEPADLPALEAWTEHGVCRLARGCWRDGVLVRELTDVTIWTRKGWREDSARLSAIPGKRRSPAAS